MIYSSWDIECGRLKLVIMDHFLPFTPTSPKSPKNQNFEKTKKIVEDVMLSMFTKNHNHMRYSSLDKEWNTDFFVILGHFLPFYLSNNPEKQNFEKMKKASVDVIILHVWTKNHNHMVYASWNMKHSNCHFGWFFAPLPE